jgi:uncharacterized protein YyaL (SSP411 family)
MQNNINHKYTNNLINETSPYLLQHAHNPVNWYAWGEEALNKARSENKLLIISIGYAACHWCHVMEHECFEDEEVAEFMNANFVSIKVDREERPDIDSVYMSAVQLINGNGGWPLNCIALPDGRPIYGGTYFPKAQWLDMLSQVANFVKQNPVKTEEQAKALTDGVKASELLYSSQEISEFNKSDLDAIFNNWKTGIDFELGGHKRAPKFPLPVGYQFLLNYFYLTQTTDAFYAVKITLDKMADGGIYDQIGGGFARYSTDVQWKVPHFEKMLYDNAQLVSLYSSAYQLCNDPYYKSIVTETLEFCKRELTSPENGFYSSLDADSEGVEGKFYIWTKSELKDILGENSDLMCDYYNVTDKGNWEHGQNILLKSTTEKAFADKQNISETELTDIIKQTKTKLLEVREKRIRPGLDDKILTSWNAMMLKGYIDAYRVFGKEDYLSTALKTAEFIITKLKTDENRLYRNYKNGKATINAFLDDYAFTIEAFIALYQATFDEKWLYSAQSLTEYTIAHFADSKSGMFFYTSNIDPELIARTMELSDNVIPAANSTIAKNLYVLGQYFYNDDYIGRSQRMLENVHNRLVSGSSFFANWDILLAWFTSGSYLVAIVGEDCENLRKEFDQHYLPNVFLAVGKEEGTLPSLKGKLIPGHTTIYVCKDKLCKMPVTDVKKALEQITF